MGISEALQQVVGIPHEEVNAWGIQRREGGRWARLTSANDAGAHIREWPLTELSLDVIRARWGVGEYRILWLVLDPTNDAAKLRVRSGGNGRTFELEDVAPVRVPPPSAPVVAPPSVSPFGPDFERAMALVRMGDERAAQQLANTVSLAASLAGNRGGLDASTLSLILDRQAQATAQAVAQALAPVTAQLAELRRELDDDGDDDDDDDDRSAAIGEVARAAAPALLKKGKIGSALLAYAAEHPDAVIELVKASPQLLDGLSKILSGAQQQQAAAAVPALPPTSVHPVPPRARAALRSEPADGLNGHAPPPKAAAPVEAAEAVPS